MNSMKFWAALVVIVLALLFFGANGSIISALSEARSELAATSGLACSTGVGETNCSVTLPAASAFEGTDYMTVTEASPGTGNRTSTSTLDPDGVTLTVDGLMASTAYTFDVDYRIVRAGLPESLNAAMKEPTQTVLWALGLLILLAIWLGR